MILLHDTYFEFNDISSHITGGGVLPVAIDDCGKIWFLLGKERHVNHWRGSLKWSGFEGGRKHGESVETTAAREFVEESISTILMHDMPEDLSLDIGSMTDYIQNGKYVMRIVLCILNNGDTERRYHVTYVVQVKYNKSTPSAFTTRRRMFLEIQTRSNQFSKSIETLNGLSDILPREGVLFGGVKVDCITCAETFKTGGLRVEFLDEKQKTHSVEINPEQEAVVAFLRWFHLRLSLTADLRALHTCREILEVTCNPLGMVNTVRFNDDYLEKQYIQWWSFDDITAVMRNGGYMNNEFFRAYFLPVLQRTKDEISGMVRKERSSENHACASSHEAGADVKTTPPSRPLSDEQSFSSTLLPVNPIPSSFPFAETARS